MRHQKPSPRAEYRLQEHLRADGSDSLSKKYQQLKSLTVELAFFHLGSLAVKSQIKYTVDTGHAKSVFRFDCVNHECVRGDFDLSEALALAVLAREDTAEGEVSCQGWQSKNTIDRVRCNHGLRYKLNLAYGPAVADAELLDTAVAG